MYHGAVASYPFMDHNPPSFELILPCCAHMHRFLQANPDNVVAVHCKAGKGRTGLIIVCYLLYCGLKNKALFARNFYDTQRCHDKRGLTIISQIRYAHYFEKYLRRLKQGEDCPVQEPESPAVAIFGVSMHGIPRTSHCELALVISVRSSADQKEYVVFTSRDYEPPKQANENNQQWKLSLSKHVPDGVRVAGDFKIQVFDKQNPLCHVWVHSQFMQDPPDNMAGVCTSLSDEDSVNMGGVPRGAFSLLMRKHEIDGAAKDTKNTLFTWKFQLEIVWGFIEGQTGTGPALEAACQAGIASGISSGISSSFRKKSVGHKPIPEKIKYAQHCAKCHSAGNPPLSYASFILSLPESEGGASQRPPPSSSPVTASAASSLTNWRHQWRRGSMSSFSASSTSLLNAISEDTVVGDRTSPALLTKSGVSGASPGLTQSTHALLAHARREAARLLGVQYNAQHAETGASVPMLADAPLSRSIRRPQGTSQGACYRFEVRISFVLRRELWGRYGISAQNIHPKS